VGEGGIIVRTNNGGATWTSQTNPLSGTLDYFTSVSFTDANTGTVVGTGGTIVRTTDGGASWTSQSINPTDTLLGVSFTDANTGTAVGNNGTILRTNTGGVTAVKEYVSTTIPTGFSLMQNYPNPFNPNTAIRFSLAEASFASLKVYNIVGQEITTLVNKRMSPGIYEVSWNANGLPSGVYFYRLQVGSYTETKKLVLLK
jgi:hypothetical protein